jgi:hypothetical protein
MESLASTLELFAAFLGASFSLSFSAALPPLSWFPMLFFYFSLKNIISLVFLTFHLWSQNGGCLWSAILPHLLLWAFLKRSFLEGNLFIHFFPHLVCRSGILWLKINVQVYEFAIILWHRCAILYLQLFVSISVVHHFANICFDVSIPSVCERPFHCHFTFSLLITNDDRHLFMCLLVTHILSFVKHLFKSLVYF